MHALTQITTYMSNSMHWHTTNSCACFCFFRHQELVESAARFLHAMSIIWTSPGVSLMLGAVSSMAESAPARDTSSCSKRGGTDASDGVVGGKAEVR